MSSQLQDAITRTGADLCQRLNPVVECIRNVGKEYGEIPADFQVGRTTGVLFLRSVLRQLSVRECDIERRHSLRYHRLHPEYIHTRVESINHSYNLRVLLLMCDIVRAPSSLFTRVEATTDGTPRVHSRAHQGTCSRAFRSSLSHIRPRCASSITSLSL
jgi:hypothetical protein